jgi:hypothetical protein
LGTHTGPEGGAYRSETSPYLSGGVSADQSGAESTLGTSTRPEGCPNRSQASHLSGRSSADQNSKSGEMGEGESREEIARSLLQALHFW